MRGAAALVGALVGTLRGNFELDDLLVQGVAIDTEQLGGLQLVAAGALQRQLDERPLDPLHDERVQIRRLDVPRLRVYRV